MRDPNQYRATDEAALIEAMAREWTGDPEFPRGYGAPDGIRLTMRRLRAGTYAPVIAADHAALALLHPPPDDGDPVTAENRAAMATCPTCGGDCEIDGGGTWVDPCPPPPDGCGGTGRRGG